MRWPESLVLIFRSISRRTVAYALLALSVSPAFAFQQPGAVDPNAEDPERRKILQLILELEKGTNQQLSRSAETFDIAWDMAVRREDPLLNSNTGDAEILKPGQHEVNAGARARLQNIYNTSSDAFKSAYETFAAKPAEEALRQALEVGSTRELTQVILRHQFTASGQQALENIVQLRRSRGEYLAGALQFERLLWLRNDSSINSRMRLAEMWWAAGIDDEAIDQLRSIAQQSAGAKASLNDRSLVIPEATDDLAAWMSQHFKRPSPDTKLWAQPQGSYRRTKSSQTGPAELSKLWRISSFECAECVDCLDEDEINKLLGPLASGVEEQFRRRLFRNQTTAPVAVPLVIGDQLIYRAAAKIRAINRVTGELQWESTLIDRKLNSALESWRRRGINDEAALIGIQNNLLGARADLGSHWMRANIGGQLTTDGSLVFAVEESTSETMKDAVRSQVVTSQTPVNYLRAYDVRTGWLKGQAGGSMGASGRSGRVNPLAGMYFLGAPLILGDHIYVMAESDQGIFLLQLRTVPLFDEEGQVDLRPIHSQLLSIPRRSLREHPVRKLAGLIPSFGNGLLICNSCDEQVMAVSAADHSIRWVYRYPGNVSTSELTRQPVLGNAFNTSMSDERDQSTRWIDALPRIHAGQVYLTPRDSDRLICLDLSTGEELWTKPRAAMRQLVVVQNDRLVLTGQRQVECRSPATGELIWKYEFDKQRICGRAVHNEKVIHIPTSGPSVVTLDIQTGRKLLQQKVPEDLPGNLLSLDGKLYSQNISGVTAYAVADDRQDSQIARAKQLLLDRQITDAEEVIAAVRSAENSAETSEANDLLVDLLFESLRLDFQGTADRIPELQQLMESSVASDDDTSDLVLSMIGMSPGDVTIIPQQWEAINEQKRRLSQLRALVSEKFQSTEGASPGEMATQMLELLDASSKETESTRGNVLVKSRRTALASVYRALQKLQPNQASSVKAIISNELTERIKTAASPIEALTWWQALLALEITEPLPNLVNNNEIKLPSKYSNAVEELSLLQAAGTSSAAGEQLLKRWADRNPYSVVEIYKRSQRTALLKKQQPLKQIASATTIGRDFLLPNDVVVPPGLASQAYKASKPNPWLGTPEAKLSPARIGESPARLRLNSPLQNIPIFGKPGAFANWSLLQRPSSPTVFAYDEDGRLRWTFDPGRFTMNGGYRQIPPSYAVAYGHLLAVKMNNKVFMLDCSTASASQPPAVLWDLNFLTDVGQLSESQRRSKAFQTTTQYDIQPPGFFPLAEISPHGVAIYSGQTLVMLNTITGEKEWMVDGVPDDCSLTSTDDEVLLLSSGAGTAECRSVLDGSINSVQPLPDWWVDSNENSNASIYQLELNPGDQERWRLTVGDGRCLVLRRNTEASALELYDFKTARNEWSIDLPQDSVVSNVVDGHVAILSAGSSLQILDVHSGARVCKHDVPESKQSMYLYLRRSGGQWLTITSTYETDYYEQNPVSFAVRVNGNIFSVNCLTGDLSWTKPIEFEWLKALTPPQATMPPNIPLLVLTKRPGKLFGPDGLRKGGIQYQANIIDVRTGDVVYQGENLGRNLSYHCMNIDQEKRIVTIGFGERDVVITYGDEEK